MTGADAEPPYSTFDGTAPYLTVSFTVPPAVVQVVDSEGRRNGVDPAQPVEPHGVGSRIQEIPLSQVMQSNIGSDEPGHEDEGDPETHWGTDIATRTPQTYTIKMRGIPHLTTRLELGIEKIILLEQGVPSETGPRFRRKMEIRVLMAPGQERELVVHFDPIARTMTVDRVVTGQILLDVVGAACATKLVTAEALAACNVLRAKRANGELDAVVKTLPRVEADLLMREIAMTEGACSSRWITSEGICRSLQAKAQAVAAAEKRGNKQAVRGALRAFLSELRAQGGKHVLEPAFTILREEAEALLNPPPAPRGKPKAKR